MKLIILINITVTLSGCTSLRMQDDYLINEVVIRNNASYNIHDVAIKVKDTQGVFGCSYIPAKSECSNKFPASKYLGNPIIVTWTHKNDVSTTDRFVVAVPEGMDRKIPLRGVVIVEGKNQIRTYLDQNGGDGK